MPYLPRNETNFMLPSGLEKTIANIAAVAQ